MIKIFTLGSLPYSIIENHLEDHPRMIGEESSRHMITNIHLNWMLSSCEPQDKGNNVENWSVIVDQVTSVLKNEKDAENIVLIAPAVYAPCMVESRDIFLERVSDSKGVGPKRLEMIRRLLKFWVPCGHKVTANNDNWRESGVSTWNPGDRERRHKQQPQSKKKFEFLRWVRV